MFNNVIFRRKVNMKFYYTIAINAQLALAIFFGNESKAAYLLYLWSELSREEVPARRRPTQFAKVSKYTDARSNVSETEYSLFLEP
jgi:hypothetical protein